MTILKELRPTAAIMLNAINLKEKHRIFSSPVTEVEHRTSHRSSHSELNVFETQKEAFDFDLVFHNPVVISMVQGKKVMHLSGQDSFEFLPGQTIAMPSSSPMNIDFPEACAERPTQCMALEISPDLISEVCLWLNENRLKADGSEWNWTQHDHYLNNDEQLNGTINSLFSTMIDEDHGLRDFRAAYITKDLVAQLMRTRAKEFLVDNAKRLQVSNRLANAVYFIQQNITSEIKIEALAERACLSRAQFFRAFKNELGLTPVQFINLERVRRAKRILLKPSVTPYESALYAGFKSQSYFNRVFKTVTGMTPGEWRSQQLLV